MTGKQLYRLRRNGVLRSLRDNGNIYDKDPVDKQWTLWTRLDPAGVRRIKAIVAIMEADGWRR